MRKAIRCFGTDTPPAVKSRAGYGPWLMVYAAAAHRRSRSPKPAVTMPKRPITFGRNARSRCAETRGHDAETDGHDGPKYPDQGAVTILAVLRQREAG
jgi:hypothetical protein